MEYLGLHFLLIFVYVFSFMLAFVIYTIQLGLMFLVYLIQSGLMLPFLLGVMIILVIMYSLVRNNRKR